MSKPLIQIDDIGTTREMTEEEHEYYLELYSNTITPSIIEPPQD
jgi:hypothetical protein